MSNTNKIVTEGKTVSDLPKILGFTSDAVVLVVDRGKTAQMSLGHLVNEITNSTVGKDSNLAKRLEENEKGLTNYILKLSELREKVNSFELGVLKRFTAHDKEYSKLLENVNGIAYYTDSILSTDSRIQRDVLDTTIEGPADSVDIRVGDKLDLQTRLLGNEEGFLLVKDVKAGEVMTYSEDFTGNVVVSPNIVVTDDSLTILEYAAIEDILEMHSYTFQNDGVAYIPFSGVGGSGVEVLSFEVPIDFEGIVKTELPPVTTEDNGKVLQVTDGKWSAVPVIGAEGSEY